MGRRGIRGRGLVGRDAPAKSSVGDEDFRAHGNAGVGKTCVPEATMPMNRGADGHLGVRVGPSYTGPDPFLYSQLPPQHVNCRCNIAPELDRILEPITVDVLRDIARRGVDVNAYMEWRTGGAVFVFETGSGLQRYRQVTELDRATLRPNPAMSREAAKWDLENNLHQRLQEGAESACVGAARGNFRNPRP